MTLTHRVTHFMHLYWQSKWDEMRLMVTDDFVWENRPSEGVFLTFDDLVEVTRAFVEGLNGWTAIEEGRHTIIRSIESGNEVAQERMDMWRTSGRWFRMPCAGFWTFRGDRIASWNDYFDMERLQAYKAGTLPGDDDPWEPVHGQLT